MGTTIRRMNPFTLALCFCIGSTVAAAQAGCSSIPLHRTRSHEGPTAVDLATGSQPSTAIPEPTRRRIMDSYGSLPVSFEANRGQADADVAFLSRGRGYALFLTPAEAVLVLRRGGPGIQGGASPADSRWVEPLEPPGQTVVRMQLLGSNPAPLVTGLEELPGKSSYFAGAHPSGWHTDVPRYAKVRYREIYPGIDVVYHGGQRQLEYDFVLAPGADPAPIELGFQGAEDVKIDGAGDLVLQTKGGELRLHEPRAYQDVRGSEQSISARYVLLQRDDQKGEAAVRVGIAVAAYDRGRPLVIDPVLSYSTYLGGGSDDFALAIAVDAAGHAYVAGFTVSSNFPITAGAFDTAFGGINDAFVTKLDPTGSTLLYSTYLGGSSVDRGLGIAVDAAGHAFVTGSAVSSNFPTTAGAFDASFSGANDVFVTKLDATGSALLYSTYLGGTRNEAGTAIAVDGAGNAHVTGNSNSSDFPRQAVGFGKTCGASDGDAFLTKLDPAGASLLYSTCFGGQGFDEGTAIALDAAGNAYVTGMTGVNSLGNSFFPTTPGAFDRTYNGGLFEGDAFVTKVDPAGATLVYSTYLGGYDDDVGRGIAVDASGHAFVTGDTRSPNFPLVPGAFDTTYSAREAFVTKLDPAGATLLYSTYLGGSGGADIGRAIAVDAGGNASVIGTTSSSDFPTTAMALDATYGGGTDGFVTTLDPAGSMRFSTYLGGSSNDEPRGIALDAAGGAYVTGYTFSTNFSTTPGAFQTIRASGNDSFVVKIGDLVDRPPNADAGPDQTVHEGDPVTLDGSGSGDPDGDSLSYAWTQIAGPPVTLSGSDSAHPTFPAPSVAVGGATLTFQLGVSDGVLTSGPDTVDVIVMNVDHPPVADAGDDQTVKESALVVLDGSFSFDPDGEALSYLWIQTVGPPVALSDPGSVAPSFTAPVVGPEGAALVFELTVGAGPSEASDAVTVRVENVNQPPVADAGADQTKDEGSPVILDGTGSADPDGDPLTYAWTQASGSPVILSDSGSASPSFTAPFVEAGGEALAFTLVVGDGLANSGPDQVTVTVLNVNDPPSCGLARPSIAFLWPPDHRMHPVEIVGVADPDDGLVHVTVTGVTQDEPVNGLGDGDTSPDAVVQDGRVLLRAERSGIGNGRAYRVTFTADDGEGGSCTGSVRVGVPHARRSIPVDDGQVHDSLLP